MFKKKLTALITRITITLIFAYNLSLIADINNNDKQIPANNSTNPAAPQQTDQKTSATPPEPKPATAPAQESLNNHSDNFLDDDKTQEILPKNSPEIIKPMLKSGENVCTQIDTLLAAIEGTNKTLTELATNADNEAEAAALALAAAIGMLKDTTHDLTLPNNQLSETTALKKDLWNMLNDLSTKLCNAQLDATKAKHNLSEILTSNKDTAIQKLAQINELLKKSSDLQTNTADVFTKDFNNKIALLKNNIGILQKTTAELQAAATATITAQKLPETADATNTTAATKKTTSKTIQQPHAKTSNSIAKPVPTKIWLFLVSTKKSISPLFHHIKNMATRFFNRIKNMVTRPLNSVIAPAQKPRTLPAPVQKAVLPDKQAIPQPKQELPHDEQ